MPTKSRNTSRRRRIPLPTPTQARHVLPPRCQPSAHLDLPQSPGDPPSPPAPLGLRGRGRWRGPPAGPGERIKAGPPFSRSVGGAPGLRRGRQRHRRCGPHHLRRRDALPLAQGRGPAGRTPTPPTSPARKSCGRRRGATTSFQGPSRLTAGEGSARRRPPPGLARGRRGPGRRARGSRPGRGWSPAVLLPTHWPTSRGAESLLKPPRLLPRAGQGAGAGRGGCAIMCPRSRSAPTFSLRSPNSIWSPTQLQLSPSGPRLGLGPKPGPTSPSGSRTPGTARARPRRSGQSRPPSPRRSPEPLSPQVLPFRRKEGRFGGGGWGGEGGGARVPDPGHPAAGGSGSYQTLTLPSSTPTGFASAPGSPTFYPPQLPPAAVEDSGRLVPGGPCVEEPSLPSPASRHPRPHPGPLGNSRLPRHRRERGPPRISTSCLRVCPTSSSPDLPSTRRNTGALFPKMGPCLGAWPWAQVGGRNKTQ